MPNFEIVTTVLVPATATPPANAYDLTDLVTVKEELSIPYTDSSNDKWLRRAITQSSKAIANYCNRVFPVETVQDIAYIEQDAFPGQVPGGVAPLQLARWPLANLVFFSGTTNGTNTVTGIASTSGLASGQIVSGANVPAGTTISSVGSNSVTLSAAVQSSLSGVLFAAGISVIQTLVLGTTQVLGYGVDFSIDAARGWLIRLNPFTGIATTWEALPTTVQYSAGYSPIPDDLIDATLRLVTARFKARGRDPMLMSEGEPGIGQTRYWIGAAPGQEGAFAPEIASRLDNYRVPVFA